MKKTYVGNKCVLLNIEIRSFVNYAYWFDIWLVAITSLASRRMQDLEQKCLIGKLFHSPSSNGSLFLLSRFQLHNYLAVFRQRRAYFRNEFRSQSSTVKKMVIRTFCNATICALGHFSAATSQPTLYLRKPFSCSQWKYMM